MAAIEREEPLSCGSDGEVRLQERYGSRSRALAFYRNQMCGQLNEAMREFIARQEMVFVATADHEGEADCSFRAGPPGFVRVLDAKTLCYPEYRGNGVMASLGNISENGHVGMLFVDFMAAKIGLHVNGTAKVVGNDEMRRNSRLTPEVEADLDQTGGRRPERWVLIRVEEAYVHCSKHIPLLRRVDTAEAVAWGTDDERAKGGDYFGVRAGRQGSRRAQEARRGDLVRQASRSSLEEPSGDVCHAVPGGLQGLIQRVSALVKGETTLATRRRRDDGRQDGHGARESS